MELLKIAENYCFFAVSLKIVVFNSFDELQQNCISPTLLTFQAKYELNGKRQTRKLLLKYEN